jgi:iduronate 2-sulfatase
LKHYIFKGNTSIGNEFCEIDAFEDTFSVDEAITLLKKVGKADNFYLAVGMHKPHMPWQASKADFDAHPLDSVKAAVHQEPPTNMPDIAFHFTDKTIPGHSTPWTAVPDSDAIKGRRAYRAAVTGMDRKLGKLLKELDTLGLTENTAIVFHGDHGWQLGEHGEWRKMTNFELATRVPLIVKVPWLNKTVTRSDSLVELVDILPTVAELAGISLPEGETFDGTSLVPLLVKEEATIKNAAFSQYPRRVTDPTAPWKANSIIHHDRTGFTHMGYSIRTVDWRYTEWVTWNGTLLKPIWEPVAARELYDHRNLSTFPTDFDAGENENVAGESQYQSIVATLSRQIREQFNVTYPDDALV